MIISNNRHKITIRLLSNTNETLQLKYYYQQYVDGEPSGSPVEKTVNQTVDGDYKVFTIYLNQYNIGDEVKEFQVHSISNNIDLWDTHEGITILINGEQARVMPVYGGEIETDDDDIPLQVDELHRKDFALRFNKDGDYQIQAVYRGNDATELSATDMLNLHIQQPSESQTSSVYKLEFVDKNIKSFIYDDKTTVQFRLTLGGVPVSGKTIEKVVPNGSVNSQDTNANGLVSFTNSEYDVGKYKIGAYFVDQQDEDEDMKTIVDCYKDISINKATPNFWHTASPVNLGTKLQIKLRDAHNNNMIGEKVVVYVNGSPKSSKTNDSGNVWISFKKKGTYKIKAVYKGNKNFKSITSSFNFKVN